MDERMRVFLEILQQEEKTVIFETDDVTFDFETFRKTNAYASMNALEKKQYEGGLGVELLRDSCVRYATTTTNFLAEKLQAFDKEVFVVPNMLSEEDMRWAQNMKRETQSVKRSASRSTILLGYFSGTKSHDRDFASIAPALIRTLHQYPHTRLCIVGHLALGNEFSAVSNRIVRLPFADRKKHFRNIASVDINLAPLEVGDAFCEAKSELKWIEAGLVGVPTVASATRTFREAITDGEDGFVADNIDEWVAKLSLLIENADLRRKMGVAARERVVDDYTTRSNIAREYVRMVRMQ
jgi:glycosyltransferase involved in cell wall biosynthesis